MSNLLDKYHSAITQQEIQDDPAQRHVLTYLQQLVDALAIPRFTWFGLRKRKPVKGVYLYGPVGRGKTYLIDLFFQQVAEPRKIRFHFHHFMQHIDSQLRQLQGEKNPLQHIARTFSKSTRLLFLDEFLVYNIADALILAELLTALIAQDVILVATSNTAPDDLYMGGLQRSRFLPTICLIKKHCHVLNLMAPQDYRLGHASASQTYIYPLNPASDQVLKARFSTLAGQETVVENHEIHVQNRAIRFIKLGTKAIWFSFDVLCNVPRNQLDYLEIAARFKTVFISEVPLFTPQNVTQALLFTHFIDVMYDQNIYLIISAAAPLTCLYSAGEIYQSSLRTISRLAEMQSLDYHLGAQPSSTIC